MLFTLANLIWMVNEVDWELWSTILEESTKDTGRMILEMDEAMKNIQMIISIQDNLRMVKLMVMESTNGEKKKSMMVNGKREWGMEKVFGKEI